MVLMLQREVAERIVAKDSKESLLSISVKAYGEPLIVARVPRGSFSPPPKVDSAILVIENISRRFFENLAAHFQHRVLKKGIQHSVLKMVEGCFFALVRAGFAHKRKLLATNLKALIPESAAALVRCGLNPRARAEELSLDDWKKLSAMSLPNRDTRGLVDTRSAAV
jgi:16S rRNA (adenine1518-N6/adenine1519-N6)-dimethyltransferase